MFLQLGWLEARFRLHRFIKLHLNVLLWCLLLLSFQRFERSYYLRNCGALLRYYWCLDLKPFGLLVCLLSSIRLVIFFILRATIAPFREMRNLKFPHITFRIVAQMFGSISSITATSKPALCLLCRLAFSHFYLLKGDGCRSVKFLSDGWLCKLVCHIIVVNFD